MQGVHWSTRRVTIPTLFAAAWLFAVPSARALTEAASSEGQEPTQAAAEPAASPYALVSPMPRPATTGPAPKYTADWLLMHPGIQGELFADMLFALAIAGLFIGLSGLILRRARPAWRGVIPGLSFGIFFLLGGRRGPDLVPLVFAAVWAVAVVFLYLLVSLLRRPYRLRYPEAAVALAVAAVLLAALGPGTARENAQFRAESACARSAGWAVSPEVSSGERYRYCACLVQDEFTSCGGVSLVWDEEPLARCEGDFLEGWSRRGPAVRDRCLAEAAPRSRAAGDSR